jgi:hypothetical protein
MNDPPKRKNRPLSEPATTARPTHSGRNAGLGPLRSGYALPASPQPRVLFLIDAGFSSCLSRCNVLMSEIEIITDGGRRRRWSAAEKLRIVEETLDERESISVVARRNGVAPNLLYRWRR